MAVWPRDGHKKAPALGAGAKGGVAIPPSDRLEFIHYAVGEAIGDGFGGGEVEIAIGVLIDAFKRLTGGSGQNKIKLGAEFLHLLSLDVDIRGGSTEPTADEGLVDQDAGVGEEQTAPLGRAAKQDGSHRGGHAGDDHGDGRADELHGVVNGHACGDGAAGRVDVEEDFFTGAFGFQVEQLFGDVLCGLVRDGAPEKNFPLFYELVLDAGGQRGGVFLYGSVGFVVLLVLVVIVICARGEGLFKTGMVAGEMRHRK